MAEKFKQSQDDTAMMATYAAAFLLLWFMIVRLSRALVCAVWPVYLLAAIGTVKILQLYRPEDIYAMCQTYYKEYSDIIMKEYQKLACHMSPGKK